MPLFSASKRDKHSRSPTPSSRRTTENDEITPLRSRGRQNSGTVLPLTSTPDTTPRRRPRGGTANNFLAGGMYVDRKRTRRRHHPRRSFFCRRRLFVPTAISGFSCLLLLYYYSSSSRVRNMPMITDPAIHLPPTEYTKVLLRERKRLREEHWKDRLEILEQLVPKWFHRNSNESYDANEQTSHSEHSLKDEQSPPIRTLANTNDFPNQSSCGSTTTTVSVTLVVQTSPERLWILQETCQRWSHPIVAVVAVEGSDDFTSMLEAVQDACSTQLDVVVQPVSNELYPVNMLRNIGLDRVRTSHVLVADIDFVPSERLDEQIVQHVTDRGDSDAMIIPAFQRVLDPPCTTVEDCKHHLQSDGSFLPRTFDELTQCHHSKECIVFQSDNNWEGHSSTGSKQWLERQWLENDLPRQLRCFDSMRYEPYVVLRWCPSSDDSLRPVAPYYDERFHGYGKNKIQLISHIRFLGYKFFVLPEGFIVHNPHVPSTSKREWENSQQSDLHRQMDRLYESFLRDLFDKYYQLHRDEIVDQCKLDKA